MQHQSKQNFMKKRFVDSKRGFVCLLLTLNCLAALAKDSDVYRRMTRTECAYAEYVMPSLIKGYLNHISGMKLTMMGNNLDYPEAIVAAVIFISKYREESLRRYPAEMSEDFGEKCRTGKIKANNKFSRDFVLQNQDR